MPNNEEPFRARSNTGGTPGGTLLINNPYSPIPKINMTVPARYTSTQEKAIKKKKRNNNINYLETAGHDGMSIRCTTAAGN